MMTPGIDTYLTTQAATEYLSGRYVLGSEASYWGALTEAQQETFLGDALRRIEALPLRGRRFCPMQALQFPRSCLQMRAGEDIGEIPASVKRAQAEEALALLMARLGSPIKPAGKRLASATAEDLLRYWAPTSLKGAL